MRKLLYEYVRKNIVIIVSLIIFIGIFLTVFYLSGIPFDAVWYAVLLCLFIGSIFTAFDLWRFCKKHRLLLELQSQINISIDGLPMSSCLIEQDYKDLIEIIHKDKSMILSMADNSTSDMIDYYTLWAHQIKTPIAAMRLSLQVDENEKNIELESELFKVEQYVDMVLSYLRLDSDYTDFVITKYQLDDILKQAIRRYAKLFIKKKISLCLSPTIYTVLTDKKWLEFVIEQILSNSLKYTNEGKISIYLENKSTLVIEDTGIGIACEDLPRVFEKGFTGYNGRGDKKSTGIGLYLCRRILRKLGHDISIYSQVDKGTRVRIELDHLKLSFE